MAEIVNLRQARKRKQRAEKRQKGDESAARSGRSKRDKARDEFERRKSEQLLDGAKREHDDADE